MIEVQINDNFDLSKIIKSGQCFRAKEINNKFEFITKNFVVEISKETNSIYRFSCNQEEFNRIWYPYFDLERHYSKLFKKTGNQFIDKAIEYGKGIRILKQDPWETLISFIISQNKNIPSIKKSVHLLSQKYGETFIFNKKTYYAFPTPIDLKEVTETDLDNLSFGYRSKYLMDAIKKINNKTIDLKKIEEFSDEKLLEELMKIKGVGPKVASCVGLFAYNRTGLVPQDIWIKRTIQEEFNGKNLFTKFGDNAGILQQYIFYYQRKNNLG